MISRQRPLDCLSDLRLDQLLSGELSGSSEQATRTHLAGCGVCAQRHAELVADRQGFAAQVPAFAALRGSPAGPSVPSPPGSAQGRASRRWWSRLALPAAALLALGIGFRQLLRDPERAPAPSEATRTKGGGVAFGFVVRRAGRSFAGEAGQRLHPGDVLRFTLSSAEPLYAGVWGFDALGRPSPYQASPELALIPAGQRQPLPEAVELDESLGAERLVLVVCSAQVSLREIERALVASAAPQLPGDCRSESLGIVKALP